MGRTADVVPNTPILSSWGNEIRDRTVQNFTNAAERTAQWVTPPEGAVSYLRDTDRIEYWNGTAWTAFGAVGSLYHQVSGTAVNLTVGAPGPLLLTAALTGLPAGRKLRLSAVMQVGLGAFGAQQAGIRIADGSGNAIAGVPEYNATVPGSGSVSIPTEGIVTPIAGSVTYQLRGYTYSGGNAFAQAYGLTIIDVGGV